MLPRKTRAGEYWYTHPMDTMTAQLLNTLTQEFYRKNADSFSTTRTSPWAGWERLASMLAEKEPEQLSVLDLACGNLRFERYLTERFPNASISYTLVDSSSELVETGETIAAPYQFYQVDLVEELNQLCEESGDLNLPQEHDLAVSFGFMHHIPQRPQRIDLLRALIRAVRPGGLVVISLWQFMNDARLAKKAARATAAASDLYDLEGKLDEGDYLLGWQQESNTFRYCHHFSKDDVEELIEAVKPQAALLYRYQADGKSNNLNCYLVFQKA